MTLPLLDEEPGVLTFAAAEVTRYPVDEPTELVIIGAASAGAAGAVGVTIALAALNGSRVVHPCRLVSVGVPTEALRAHLFKEAQRPAAPWHVDGFATTDWRETSTRTPIHFRVRDLMWEAARFSVTLSSADHHCQLELHLGLDRQRFRLKPASLSELKAVFLA